MDVQCVRQGDGLERPGMTGVTKNWTSRCSANPNNALLVDGPSVICLTHNVPKRREGYVYSHADSVDSPSVTSEMFSVASVDMELLIEFGTSPFAYYRHGTPDGVQLLI